MKRLPILLLLVLVAAVPAAAQKKKKPKKGETAPAAALATREDSLSYALGVSMYANTAQTGMKDFDFDRFVEGMKGQKAGAPLLSQAKADSLIRAEMKRQTDAKNEASRKAGEDFLASNGKQPGVMTTASGLQYKVVTEGTGIRPDQNDKVTVHYHGMLIDGTVFDSSVDRGKPATFGLNQVIPGWTEGLQLMNEGSKYTLYIPQALAYGARGQGKIGPFSTLIFEVELIKVEKVN